MTAPLPWWCPTCGAALDDATPVRSGRHRPKPGDFSLCLYCGELLVFDELGAPSLRGELADLEPRDQALVGLARELIRRRSPAERAAMVGPRKRGPVA